MKKMLEKFKKNKSSLVLIILALVLIIAGISFALFNPSINLLGRRNIKISKCELDINFKESDELMLVSKYPIKDSEALKYKAKDVVITNNSTCDTAYYKLTIKDLNNSSINKSKIKFQLVDKTSGNTTNGSNPDTFLVEDSLTKGKSKSYSIRLWIDEGATNSDIYINGDTSKPKEYKFALNIEAYDELVDDSIPNAPALTSNMIPVYYDESSKVWRKADSTNKDNSWYDYNNKMWANAVTVSEQDGYAESVASSSTVSLSNDVTYSKVPSSGEAALVENDTVYSNYSFNSSTGLYTLNGTTTSVTKSNFQSLSGNYYCQSGSNTACTIMAYCSSYSSGGMFQGTVRAVYVANIYTSTSTVEQKYLSSSYTFNKNTGAFTLTSPSLSAYSTSSVGKYTCDSSTSSTCNKMYKIVTAEENKVTKADTYEKNTKYKASTKYNNASVGAEISMNDISTMWVWIPRYKYTYLNTNTPQEINVKFESGTASTGTIKCTDNVAGTSSTSETCTDTTNNGLVAGTSTYTHPAFWWDKNDNNVREENEELTGIWVGKFEVSSDTSCTPSDNVAVGSGCNLQTIRPNIKPNVISWRGAQLGTFFNGIQKMRESGNQYGFSTTDETHMMKNMEWGAVTYLSHSKYGINKEVAINSANTYTTGCGPQSNGSTSVGATCNSYTTTLGQSASTTGNVYGVYDMSGGAVEYMMGNMVYSNGQQMSGRSTSNNWNSAFTGILYDRGASFTGTYAFPSKRYYDKYSYGTSDTEYTRGKLGDATKEMAPPGGTGNWYGDYANFVNSDIPWVLRGGYCGDGAHAGSFDFDYYTGGDANTTISARAVISNLN